MNDPIKDKLAKKSMLIKFDEEDSSHSAMLSLIDNEKFEVTWNGDHKPGRVIASYKEGYVSFYTSRAAEFFGVEANSTTINPKVLISAKQRELVEADKYDRLTITYNNIFRDFGYDIGSPKAVNILEQVGRKAITLNDGEKLEIWVGCQIHTTYYPVRKIINLDDLNFCFTKDGHFDVAVVNKYLDIATKVISLYLEKPIDPKKIRLGLREEGGEKHFNDALVEYGRTNEYANLDRSSSFYPVHFGRASSMAEALQGAFKTDISRILGVWFSYTEAAHKKYYLDTLMSILLSCAESIYYLLPAYDTSKREKEYAAFLENIDIGEINPIKLRKFITSAKNAYIDPVTYETKILKLIEYSGLDIPNKKILASYLSQLRNSLMHGTEPNFDYLVDRTKGPIQPVNIGEVLTQLKLIVSASIIKYLQDHR